jgi:hypothetical protein
MDREIRLDVVGFTPAGGAPGSEDAERERFERAVNERAELITQAKQVLPECFKYDDLTPRQIREAALKAMGCTKNFTGLSADYVHGHFDHYMAERARKPTGPSSRMDSLRSTRSRTDAQRRLDARHSSPAEWECSLSYSSDPAPADSSGDQSIRFRSDALGSNLECSDYRRTDAAERNLAPWQEPCTVQVIDDVTGEAKGLIAAMGRPSARDTNGITVTHVPPRSTCECCHCKAYGSK